MMLLDYLSAIWSDVLARLGGIVALLFTAAGVFSQTFSGSLGGDRARKFWWLAAALCFALSSYRVWAEERQKRISTMPDFVLVIEQIHYEYMADDDVTVMIFAATLVNRGAPSIVQGWSGTIEVNDIAEKMRFFNLADRWIITRGNQRVTLRPKDQLDHKTIQSRVLTGEGKAGRLFFNVPGDRMALLQSLHYKVTILCHDFTGKRFESVFTPSPVPVIGVSTYADEEGEIIPNENRSMEAAADVAPVKIRGVKRIAK
jgi:hypothetical protein